MNFKKSFPILSGAYSDKSSPLFLFCSKDLDVQNNISTFNVRHDLNVPYDFYKRNIHTVKTILSLNKPNFKNIKPILTTPKPIIPKLNTQPFLNYNKINKTAIDILIENTKFNILNQNKLIESNFKFVNQNKLIVNNFKLMNQNIANINMSNNILSYIKPIHFNKVKFNEIVLPKTHINLLKRKGFKDKFTATKIINHTTYLKSTDNDEYTDINDIANTYAIYDENWGFEENDIIKFIKYIQESPSLILAHEIGKKIYDEIENYKLENFEANEDLTLFRARGTEDNFPLVSAEMGIVPYDISKGGRFDHLGNQLLYTAQNKEVALLEVYDYSNNDIEFYHIQEYIYINTLKLADLTKIHNNMLNKILHKPIKNNGQEYILPRFIAECIKQVGYDGFVIKSSKSSLKHDDLNFNFFSHAVGRLEEGNYNILPKSDVESLIEYYE